MVFWMPKTLVIAEKPSVGRDLAGALEGPFQRRKLDDIKPKRGKTKAEDPTNEEVVEAAKSPAKTRTTRDDERPQHGVEELGLGHEAQLAARPQRHAERPRVEVRGVVRGQDEAAATRDVDEADDAQAVQPAHER